MGELALEQAGLSQHEANLLNLHQACLEPFGKQIQALGMQSRNAAAQAFVALAEGSTDNDVIEKAAALDKGYKQRLAGDCIAVLAKARVAPPGAPPVAATVATSAQTAHEAHGRVEGKLRDMSSAQEALEALSAKLITRSGQLGQSLDGYDGPEDAKLPPSVGEQVMAVRAARLSVEGAEAELAAAHAVAKSAFEIYQKAVEAHQQAVQAFAAWALEERSDAA